MSASVTTNEEAHAWLQAAHVSRETVDMLKQFEAHLRAAMTRQNLIARSTLDTLWARHIVDSAQLVPMAEDAPGPWLDLGAGAGFPGLVVAILERDRPVHLVESRALRCEFLLGVADALQLDNVIVHHDQLDRVASFPAAVISARAFAPLPRLLAMAARFSDENTRWLLPKGKKAVNELESVAKAWQRLFHVKHSVTDADSRIVVGTGKLA